MSLDYDAIPEDWMEDWDWNRIEKYQAELGTSLLFKEAEVRGLMKDALAYGAKFFDRFEFSPQHQTVYIIPADTEDAAKDIVPVMGWTGRVPGTNIPEQFQQAVKDLKKPHGLRNQEKITTPTGHTYNKWDLAEERLEKRMKYAPSESSLYLSHTDLTLHKPNYPAFAVWEFNFGGKGWGIPTVNSYGKLAQQLIPDTDRIFFRPKGNRLRLFIFAERPNASHAFKESMFMGYGRLQIESNRTFFCRHTETD